MLAMKVSLERFPLSQHWEQTRHIDCSRCNHHLELHQPNLEEPDRMLGICSKCGNWFLIDIAGKLVTRLPDLKETRG
jgi:hypothetical protein